MKRGNVITSIVGIVLLVAFGLFLIYFATYMDVTMLGLDQQSYFESYRQNMAMKFSPKLRSESMQQELIDEAKDAFKKKEYEEARELAERVLANDPSNGTMHALVANSIARTETPEVAIAYLEGLGDSFANDKQVQRALARLIYRDDPKRSLGIYVSLAEAWPDDPQCHIDAGRMMLRIENDRLAAKEYFNCAIALDGENEDAYVGLLNTTDDRNEMKEIYNQLIKIDPSASRYTGQLGWMEYEDGNFERAYLFSKQAVIADPSAYYAQFNQALAELRLGKESDAWGTYVNAAAACIEQHARYPFDGAITDLDDIPIDENPVFVSRVKELLIYGDRFASEGVIAYLEFFGEDAHEIEGPDFLTGESIALSDFRGKLVFIDFWATWCGPCVYEFPNVVELQETLGGDRFQVLSASLDNEGEEDALKEMIEEYGINYPVIYTGDGWEQPATTRYGVNYIPNTWVISPEGKILYHDLRGKDPLRYCKKYLESSVETVGKYTAETEADLGGLSFKVSSETGIVKEVNVTVMIPLEYGEGEGMLVENHHFMSEDAVVEQRIDFARPENALPFTFWSVEVPTESLPDPFIWTGLCKADTPEGDKTEIQDEAVTGDASLGEDSDDADEASSEETAAGDNLETA